VSIPDRKIALIENGQVARIYPIAVGVAATPSPNGEYTVAVLIPHPTWYTPGKIVRPGPSNPLGTRWIGLSLPGYGIHGTNQPASIGHKASHGCIRMRNRDVEELFTLVRVGDAVELRGERDEEIARIFGGVEAAQPPAITAAAGAGQD
jgi:lipoprotein-anchoring transpeptidase ErfK/SrfK